MTLPPLALQSSALVSVLPLLLQAFFPLQSFWAVLHEPWPLQLLMPKQLTCLPPVFASSARATTAPEIKSIAAVLAIKMFFAFISFSFWPEWPFVTASQTSSQSYAKVTPDHFDAGAAPKVSWT